MAKSWIKILRWIWAIFGNVFLMIVFVGLLVFMAKDLAAKEYKFFLEFAQISLTLFGITLIGGIFERKNESSPIILKRIFGINLCFLSSFIGFIFLNSYQILDLTKVTDHLFLQFVSILLNVAIIMGFLGFLGGVSLLIDALLEHYSSM
jgi:hypothetical protein